MTRTKHPTLSISLGTALALVSGSISSQELYRLTDLGTLGGPTSTAIDINNSGQVTGDSLLADRSTIRAFRVQAGRRMVDLGTFAACRETDNLGRESTALAINSSGQVAGTSCNLTGPTRAFVATPGKGKANLGTLTGGHSSFAETINNNGEVTGFSTINVDGGASERHAFRASAGQSMTDLGVCPAGDVGFPAELVAQHSHANDINDAGQVVGLCTSDWFDPSGGVEFDVEHAFIASPGQPMVDLGTLGGNHSNAFAINRSGQVTGFSAIGGADETHAFLWSDGTGMQDLGTLGGGYSAGTVINARGFVAGESATEQGAGTHAFLWNGSSMIDLGSLGGTFTGASAINNAGQVTGTSPLPDESKRAYVSNGGNSLRDLNSLIDPSDPLRRYVTLQEGVDINQRGQIAANGCDRRTGECHAYVATPLEYRIRFVSPASNSSMKRGSIVRVRALLIDKNGDRITDARAATFVKTPCRMKFTSTGAQSRSATCMKYDSGTDEFYFNWRLGASGTGSTSLKVAAKYKFSMPQTITTQRARTITVTQ
jgi:probable HAF family extracellular repeat protein